MNKNIYALMAAASCLAFASAAQAQDAVPDAPVEVAETQTDAAAQLEFMKAQLDALQAQLNELQKKNAATDATWKNASWSAETKISGRMYFDFSNLSLHNNGSAIYPQNKSTNFELKRFYLGVDHKFNDVFSANLTTDVTWSSGIGASLYIKKAYLQAKLNDALVVKLGAADTPWIPFVESIYGYRHIEQTVSDRTKFGTSSDWGVHASGKLAGGIVEYDVAALNGGGYRNVPGVGGTRSRGVDLEGRVNVNYKGFIAGVGGYTGKLGKVTTIAPAVNTADRINGVLAYKGKMFTVGGEYFTATNWNNVTGSISLVRDVKSEGWSAFGSVAPIDKWSAFARYDSVKTDKFLNTQDEYFNVGVQYSPAKIVDLALVYKHDEAKHGSVSTGNGTITGGATAPGKYDEIGIFGQFRF